ncbi:unnamed protein product [Allacma fusca]|uniref:Protein msta n=1 Tax=Allacma fusca TaxID=39272 RepID=A0A8J2LRC5_9HEXA|nr:unnamed protein product [Allacma fusca]
MECAQCQGEANRKCTGCWNVVYCTEEHQRQHWTEHKKTCSPPLALKTDLVFGQHWVAARDLSPGTLLVKELPALKLSSWPFGIHDFYEWNDDATCLGCGFHIREPCFNYLCSKCGWPVCDVDCEKASIHADNECQVFSGKNFSFPPPEVSLISPRRIDWAVSAIRASRLKITNPRLYRELNKLQHKPSIPMPRMFEETLRTAVHVLNVLLDIESMGMSADEIVRLFWIVKLNAFNCAEMENEEEGNERARTDCLYPKLSKFNNSCAPNCSYSMKPKPPDYRMMVRTAIAVKQGEPLTIPYTDILCGAFEERQKGFTKRFFFICKCKRCVDPSELGTYYSAVACKPCYEDRQNGAEMDANIGYLLPEDPYQALADGKWALWKCNRCNKKTSASTFLPTVEKLSRLVKKPVMSLQMAEKLKKQYSEKFLHPNHWILQLASQGALQHWDKMTAQDTDEFPFEAFKTHLFYRLEAENVLNPGISHDRAHLQRDFVRAALTTQQLEKSGTTSSEKVDLVKTCYEFIRESNKFFEYYQEGVPQGAINFLVTSHLKNVVEEIMEALSVLFCQLQVVLLHRINTSSQQVCKLSSVTSSRGCRALDESRLNSVSSSCRTTAVSSTKYYSKGTRTSLSSNFYTKPAIMLKNTDNDVVQRIAEFESETPDDLLMFLETLDSQKVDLRTIEVTSKMLTLLLEKDSSVARKEIFRSVGMQRFCRILKIHSRLLDVSTLLLNLKLFSMLQVPGNNGTFQLIMTSLSKEVNRMGLPQIVYLERLLQDLCKQSSTELSEALIRTLPIVFESQLLLRPKLDGTIVELLDFLRFAVNTKCSDIVMIKLVENLLERKVRLNQQDAFRIFWALYDTRADVDGIADLLHLVFESFTKNIDDIDIKDLRLLLVKCSNKLFHGIKHFYNQDFVDVAMNRILQTGDDLLKLHSLKTLFTMRHINVEMLETCAELLISNPGLILNDDKLFYSVLKTYADLNYKPEKWDILKSIFLNHPATTNSLAKRDLSLVVNFLLLGEAPSNLFESLPAFDYLCDSESNSMGLVLIFNATKQLFPNCNGPCPSSSTLEVWSEHMRQKSKKFVYPLKEALQAGLGGDSYFITGLVHDGIHIDHCIVLRQGGYPVFQTNLNPTSLDVIQRPESSFLILIKQMPPQAYLANTNRLRGTYDVIKKILESFGHCIIINSTEWDDLNDSRKTAFLMEKIRKLTGPSDT